MHHGTDTDRTNGFNFDMIFTADISCQLGIAFFQTGENFGLGISPDPILQAVFPEITT